VKHPARKQRSDQAIARVVAEYEQSGLTRGDFSEQAGIAVSTLDYWRRRVREQDGARILPVQVELDRAAQAGPGFQLRLPNGVWIESGWDFPQSGMARLLRVAAEQ
jgi:transposase-like protein